LIDCPLAIISSIAGRPGFGDGALGVVGQPRVDLDGDPAVDAVGRVVGRPHHVTCPAHVEGRDHPHGLLDLDPAAREVGELAVVDLAAAQGLLEDRGIGGRAADVLVAHQVGEVVGHQPAAAHVVEPDGDALVGELAQRVSHEINPFGWSVP